MTRKGEPCEQPMDEKTEALRDIFTSVSDTDTVTEDQEETPGSLTDRPDVDEGVAEVVARMRDRYEFATDLDDEALCRLVRRYYDGATDADLARDLDVSRDSVVRARLDCHLFRDGDTDAPVDLGALREHLAAADTLRAVADEVDVSPATVRRYRRVLDAREEARRANHRFTNRFDELLGDGDLTGRLATDARRDGLEEATEDMETDVSM